MKLAVVTSEFPPINAAAAARIGPWVKELDSGDIMLLSTHQKVLVKLVILSILNQKDQCPQTKWEYLDDSIRNETCLGSFLHDENFIETDRWGGHHITSFFLATHIARLSKKNKVPYIFDIRDRYPNVLFDLNVISEKKA